MRTTWMFLCIINAPVLCLFWLTKHTVDSAQLSAPKVVTAPYGGNVMVSCKYDNQFRENTKYWCKGLIYDLCDIVVKTPKNRPSERCVITDNKEAGVFTITMTSLRERDQDMYWCVIATSGRNVHTAVRVLVSHTVVTPTSTQDNFLLTPDHDEISWWGTLRWILFVLILCCVVLTHIAIWWRKAAETIVLQQRFQNSQIYE